MTAKDGATTILKGSNIIIASADALHMHNTTTINPNLYQPNHIPMSKRNTSVLYLEKDGVGMVERVGKELPQQSFDPLPPLKLGILAEPASLARTLTM